jgi:hypothetical protein
MMIRLSHIRACHPRGFTVTDQSETDPAPALDDQPTPASKRSTTLPPVIATMLADAVSPVIRFQEQLASSITASAAKAFPPPPSLVRPFTYSVPGARTVQVLQELVDLTVVQAQRMDALLEEARLTSHRMDGLLSETQHSSRISTWVLVVSGVVGLVVTATFIVTLLR